MTNNNATSVIRNTTKPETGMDIAKRLYREITSTPVKEGDKSHRQQFIQLAITEAHLTTNGAATYWHNLRNLETKGVLYPYAEGVKKRKAAKKALEEQQDVFNDILDDIRQSENK